MKMHYHEQGNFFSIMFLFKDVIIMKRLNETMRNVIHVVAVVVVHCLLLHENYGEKERCHISPEENKK